MNYPDTLSYEESEVRTAYHKEIDSKYDIVLNSKMEINNFCWDGYYGGLKEEDAKTGYVLLDSNEGKTPKSSKLHIIKTTTNQFFVFIHLSPFSSLFAGWCSDEGLQNSIVSIAAGNTSDLEVYAKWESDEYSINYLLLFH